MKVSSRATSGSGHIVCPACGSGELRFRGAGLAGCDCCGRDLDKTVLRSIEQIVALPDAIGDHACECGHPEMCRLPDGVFHCPACGSEVLPLEASREPTPDYRSQAYWCGWIGGRFGEIGCFTENLNRVKKSVPAPREEWIAVPLPDAGIPKEWVIAAREAIKDNEWVSNAGDKVWELSGGVIRCADCGRAMTVNHIRAKGRGYYRCTGRYNGGIENRCSMSRTLRAEEAETRVWGFVSEILTNPHRLAQGLEKMLEDERQPSAGEDESPWLKRIAEIDLKRERLLDLHLDGDITTEQLRAKSAQLEEARAAADGQLEAARSRLARLKDLERSKEALISHYASLVPQVLTELSSKEKNRVYKTMRFHVLAQRDGTLIADWGRNILPQPPGSCRTPDR